MIMVTTTPNYPAIIILCLHEIHPKTGRVQFSNGMNRPPKTSGFQMNPVFECPVFGSPL